MDAETLSLYESSLARCLADPTFTDRFYDLFFNTYPKVRDKFVGTDLVRQRRALRASFELMLRAAREGESGPETHLGHLAGRHGYHQLAIGSEYYDFWLDSLLATVKERDPAWTPAIEKAWEHVMEVGIRFMCSRYHDPYSG